MSFCFLYNVVSENHSVQNSPWGGGGSIASSRSKISPLITEVEKSSHIYIYIYIEREREREREI